MFATVPQPLLDGQYKPTDFLRRLPGGSPHMPQAGPIGGPYPATPLQPQTPTLLPGGQLGNLLPPKPMMQPQSPIPQGQAPSLAQMRQMMTQLHMAQMVNRMQKHTVTHAGG